MNIKKWNEFELMGMGSLKSYLNYKEADEFEKEVYLGFMECWLTGGAIDSYIFKDPSPHSDMWNDCDMGPIWDAYQERCKDEEFFENFFNYYEHFLFGNDDCPEYWGPKPEGFFEDINPWKWGPLTDCIDWTGFKEAYEEYCEEDLPEDAIKELVDLGYIEDEDYFSECDPCAEMYGSDVFGEEPETRAFHDNIFYSFYSVAEEELFPVYVKYIEALEMNGERVDDMLERWTYEVDESGRVVDISKKWLAEISREDFEKNGDDMSKDDLKKYLLKIKKDIDLSDLDLDNIFDEDEIEELLADEK